MTFSPLNFGLNAINLASANQLGVDQLHVLQERRIKTLVSRAYTSSRFYKNKYGSLNIENFLFVDLPITNKKELMENFNDWVADDKINLNDLRLFLADKSNIGKHYLNKYIAWESSGTSGEPAIFLQDSSSLEIYDALEFCRKANSELFKQSINPLLINERIAFLGAVDGHFASNVSFKRLGECNPFWNSSYKAISILDPIECIVEELNTYSPTIISTYPTAAVLLANQQILGKLKTHPHQIWVGGETLSVAMRQYIENTFDVKVFNNYGASEFLDIGWQCDVGNLHLNADWVFLEAVDEYYQPVSTGQISHTTLLTNLANHVQPLIRYDLGDRICFHANLCSCGVKLPCIDVLGRQDQLININADDGSQISLLPLALSTVLEEAGLFEFQLSQISNKALSLFLPNNTHHSQTNQNAISALKNYLSQQGANNVKIMEHYDAPFKLGRSGKKRQIHI